MKKTILFLAVAFMTLAAMPSFAGVKQNKANSDTKDYRYDIECAGVGAQGTYLVKVWSYSKNINIAENQCRKNAVHGVIFKGYGGGDGCVGQRPLCSNPGAEMENEVYFKSFFADGGEFQKYASIVAGTMETIKIKKEYKVGVVVSVRKEDLRKALESAGIIKKLNAGF